jgi:hypothetical protein
MTAFGPLFQTRRAVVLGGGFWNRQGGLMHKTGRGGRPSKGERDHLVTRPHTVLGEAARAEAERRGMTISDYLAGILARELGRPDLAPVADAPTQGALLELKGVQVTTKSA